MAGKDDAANGGTDDELAPRGDPRRLRDEDEIDRMAREAEKSPWMERSAAAAGDPVSDDERKGLNVMGQSDPRGDGSINGVSDTNAGDVRSGDPLVAPRDGMRRNPPVQDGPDGSSLL